MGKEQDRDKEIVAAFVIGGVLLAWTFGVLTAADNYLMKFVSLMFAGVPGIGLVIFGIRLALKGRGRESKH
jgi:hypothetical protein